MNYEFFSPQQICFGWDRFQEVGKLAVSLGTRGFIISGSRSLEANGVIDELIQFLSQVNIASELIRTISNEPLASDVDQVTKDLQQVGLRAGDFLIGIGGGSGIDLAKACAAMVTNQESDTILDFLGEGDRALKLTQTPLPMLAIPTTAGTGSEATKNAVISSHSPVFKKSLRSDQMIPNIVLCDPKLSCSVPPGITAQTGMDAITQLLESYISRRTKPIPQALCLQGLKLALPSLAEVVDAGNLRSGRENMAHAALLSGIALANSGLGMAHGVAPALGIHCGIPHGLACAVMLPITLKTNLSTCRKEYAEISQFISPERSFSESEGAQYLIDQVQSLNNRIQIPQKLSDLGVTRAQIPDLVSSSRGSSMNGNPREISDSELTLILEELL